jgi:all-trans-retinol dehydrogenase (NAD+)
MPKKSLQLELKHIHDAPKVRLSLGIFSFIKTPLFKGETRQSGFLFPLMDVDTVGEVLADILHSGYGRTIYLPGIMRYVAILVRFC